MIEQQDHCGDNFDVNSVVRVFIEGFFVTSCFDRRTDGVKQPDAPRVSVVS